mmetsp:Transcript_77115/g.178880  ORF Transcript_77115/g.178880 Transcript_77115/m.178880 type:complete len:329 (+) Transcript_77115:386-1372(+)
MCTFAADAELAQRECRVRCARQRHVQASLLGRPTRGGGQTCVASTGLSGRLGVSLSALGFFCLVCASSSPGRFLRGVSTSGKGGGARAVLEAAAPVLARSSSLLNKPGLTTSLSWLKTSGLMAWRRPRKLLKVRKEQSSSWGSTMSHFRSSLAVRQAETFQPLAAPWVTTAERISLTGLAGTSSFNLLAACSREAFFASSGTSAQRLVSVALSAGLDSAALSAGFLVLPFCERAKVLPRGLFPFTGSGGCWLSLLLRCLFTGTPPWATNSDMAFSYSAFSSAERASKGAFSSAERAFHRSPAARVTSCGRVLPSAAAMASRDSLHQRK